MMSSRCHPTFALTLVTAASNRHEGSEQAGRSSASSLQPSANIQFISFDVSALTLALGKNTQKRRNTNGLDSKSVGPKGSRSFDVVYANALAL